MVIEIEALYCGENGSDKVYVGVNLASMNHTCSGDFVVGYGPRGKCKNWRVLNEREGQNMMESKYNKGYGKTAKFGALLGHNEQMSLMSFIEREFGNTVCITTRDVYRMFVEDVVIPPKAEPVESPDYGNWHEKW